MHRERPRAGLIFDATGIEDSSQLHSLYAFFHDALRSLGKNGRIVVFGRPPAMREAASAATAQHALEGMTRSLGKEARNGITANLLRVAQGAANYRSGAALLSFSAFGVCLGPGRDIDAAPPHAPRKLDAAARGPARARDGRGARHRRIDCGVLAEHGANVIGLDIAPPATRSTRPCSDRRRVALGRRACGARRGYRRARSARRYRRRARRVGRHRYRRAQRGHHADKTIAQDDRRCGTA